MLRAIGTRSVTRHSHVMGRRWGWPVRRADTGVILAATPREADARVADGIALHLVDGHLGRVAVDELYEAASLAGRDFDVGDLAKSLEERTELVLGNVARQTTDEHSRVVGIGKLVHLGGWVKSAVLVSSHATPHLLLLRHAPLHVRSVLGTTLIETVISPRGDC